MTGGQWEENSHSAPGQSGITLHLWNLQMILGQYQRCWGSRSKLSHEDVMWPEFSPPPLHNSVLLLSISRFHQSYLLYFGIPMQHILKPSGMQMRHLEFISCLLACLSPHFPPGSSTHSIPRSCHVS